MIVNLSPLSSDLSADVTCLHDCQRYYGVSAWFAGHRNGASGLENPNTQDINSKLLLLQETCTEILEQYAYDCLLDYRNAVYWIQSQIDSKSTYKTDDTRFWVDVPAI